MLNGILLSGGSLLGCLARCVYFVSHGSQFEAMSQRPTPMSDGEWRMFLTLLDRAQDRGRIGEALHTLGCSAEDATRISAQLDAHHNQQVIRPKAKAKAAAVGGAASSMAAGSDGSQAVLNATGQGAAMTDASKRLRDGEAEFEDEGFIPAGEDFVEDPDGLIQQFNHGLPSYRPAEPPRGPVRELWNVTDPVGSAVPFPHGVSDLAQWGATVLTMPKYKGWSFEQLFDDICFGQDMWHISQHLLLPTLEPTGDWLWWSGYGLVWINYVTMLRLGSRLNICRLEIRFGFAFLHFGWDAIL